MQTSLSAARRRAGILGLSAHGACHRARRQVASWALTPRFHPYPSRGGIFSVALSLTAALRPQPLPVRKHGGSSCPDFPPYALLHTAIEQSMPFYSKMQRYAFFSDFKAAALKKCTIAPVGRHARPPSPVYAVGREPHLQTKPRGVAS